MVSKQLDQQAGHPALKHWFDEARFRQVAEWLGELHDGFDRRRYMRVALPGLEELSLLQRLRRMTEAVHEGLRLEFLPAIEVLKELAPKMDHGFVTLFLPDYVGLHGRGHFDDSMEALRYFTSFGSSEFAVREFLRMDLSRAMKWMRRWSQDENEHVRRLASEGCRPRLPWSFRLEAFIKDPSPVLPILENLKADESLYVRKSVANHLNDISKDHPTLALETVRKWGLENRHTAWIAKRALRTLIKKGDKQALDMFGAGEIPQVKVLKFAVTPKQLRLGDVLALDLELESTADVGAGTLKPQKLVIDYVIHYVKKDGGRSPKVFKWKEVALGSGERLRLEKRQQIRNFSTRVHHAGRHQVEVMVNGEKLAGAEFLLVVE